MEKNPSVNNYGKTIISWEIPEYETHERTKGWYTAAIIAALLLLMFSLLTSNFLFALIIIIAALVVVLHDGREPNGVKFSITDEGVVVGKKYFDYNEIKNFSMIYKPRQGVKNLYFDYKNTFRQRLSIPLLDQDPLPIRKNLLKYLTEDLNRTDQPLSEGLAKIFKL